MLTQLSPPSDNLYKFLSVLGIVLTASCFFGAYQQEERLLTDMRVLAEELTNYKASLDQIKDTNGELYAKVTASIEAAKQLGLNEDDEATDELKEALQNYKDFTANLKDPAKIDELGLSIATSSAKRTVSYLSVLRWLSWIFAFATIGCFILWYKRHQKYNDKLIQLKILFEENRLKIQNSTSDS